ncbi:Uncharacterized protein Adt_32183 [Abeliophyllum distichum]|uniref:Uncharacterized protein n=1 Tax=Abeliophyllum distichum TaxID=126358 RepID=A0ABD1RG69_9LAMI
MSGWDFQQTKLDGESVSKFLDTEIQIMQLMVKRTLVPSQEEAEEEFYQGMTPLDDVEDSRVDNSLDEDGIEESEEDEPSVSMHQLPRDRPSSSHDNNVLKVVRQEMIELESRLVRVINGRCDHIETKLDKLLKLVGSSASQPQGGEFQSDKSGFQSETRKFNTYSPHHEDNIPEENKGWEEDCVFEAAVENSVNVEDCTYEEEQVTPIQGMLSNPSTAIVVYREMPRILIPDSKHRLGEHEPVDVVMSNQSEQSAESCPKGMMLHWQSVMPGGHFLRIFMIRVGGSLVTHSKGYRDIDQEIEPIERERSQVSAGDRTNVLGEASQAQLLMTFKIYKNSHFFLTM